MQSEVCQVCACFSRSQVLKVKQRVAGSLLRRVMVVGRHVEVLQRRM